MRHHLEKEIAKKQAEVDALERELFAAKAVLSAYKELLKKTPQEQSEAASLPVNKPDLRVGSDVARAREAILQAGRSLHIGELVTAIGKENTKANRISLAGSLGAYVRKGHFFTKTGPNVFGVVGMKQQKPPTLVQDSLPMTG